MCKFGRDGNHVGAVQEDRIEPSASARECPFEQFAGTQRDPLCGRAWRQVARPAQAVRQLAFDLCTHERWAKNGVLDRVFEQLQLQQIIRIRIEAFSLDSTSVKVHPDGTGALKKTDPRRLENLAEDGTPRFIWLPRMLERPSASH